jgi:2-(3-amino-3-carboxypropyl)histidine synthase
MTEDENNGTIIDSPYDLEVDRIIETIKNKSYKKICLQLPDGLKIHALNITDRIRDATGVEVIIWAGSNFGACDLPLEVSKLGVDALFHFGHSCWR